MLCIDPGLLPRKRASNFTFLKIKIKDFERALILKLKKLNKTHAKFASNIHLLRREEVFLEGCDGGGNASMTSKIVDNNSST